MGVGGAVGVVWRHGDGGDGSCNGRAITGATATAVDGLPLNAAQRWMDGGRAHPTLDEPCSHPSNAVQRK